MISIQPVIFAAAMYWLNGKKIQHCILLVVSILSLLLTEVPGPSQESERSCILLVVSILSLLLTEVPGPSQESERPLTFLAWYRNFSQK
jgi:hypothetical protein